MSMATLVVGYVLFTAEVLLIGAIGVTYVRAWRVNPRHRRLLPAHVVLVAAGTLWLSGTATARMISFQHSVLWNVNTVGPVAMIVAALVLVLRWQHRKARPELPTEGPI